MTGYNVQGRCEPNAGPMPRYVGQHCLACGGMHVVNPSNGLLMTEEETESESATPPGATE